MRLPSPEPCVAVAQAPAKAMFPAQFRCCSLIPVLLSRGSPATSAPRPHYEETPVRYSALGSHGGGGKGGIDGGCQGAGAHGLRQEERGARRHRAVVIGL